MKYIQLTQEKFAMVDDEDYDYISRWEWFLISNGYAGRDGEQKDNVRQKQILMHRVIAAAPDGMEVDHINGNGTDNRKENLRVCTHQENIWNGRMRKDNTTGYKGVSWAKDLGKYVAKIRVNGKLVHLGYFVEKEDAAKAYWEAAERFFGEFAKLS